MSWFPSLRISPTLEQRRSDWGLLPRFEPTAKITKQRGKVTSFAGALTHMDSEGGQTVSDMAQAEGQRLKLRFAGKVERLGNKAITASGNRFVVKNRDGHPRGWYPTVEEAEAKAGDDATVYDRIEGRNLNRKKRRYDIPDHGVEVDPYLMDYQ